MAEENLSKSKWQNTQKFLFQQDVVICKSIKNSGRFWQLKHAMGSLNELYMRDLEDISNQPKILRQRR